MSQGHIPGMGWIIRAIASGFVAFAAPRIAIAAGMPIDIWVAAMGEWLGASVSRDEALWGVTLAIGLALFGIESWRHPVQRLWGALIGTVRSEAHKEDSPTVPLTPDWPMKELCQHVLNNIDDSEQVIREIETKARLGDLACWGRRHSALSASDNPNPLRPIQQEHWDEYSLDYLRCVMHEDLAECCTEPRDNRGDHAQSFQDLQVNRQQSLSIWPERSD